MQDKDRRMCEKREQNSLGREILASKCEIEVAKHGTWVWMESHGGETDVAGKV